MALTLFHVTTETRFSLQNRQKYHTWSCQNVCDTLAFLLVNIFIRFGTKLYCQVVGIPLGPGCGFFLVLLRGGLLMSLSTDKQAYIIDAFNTKSRYLDNIFNIDNICILTI